VVIALGLALIAPSRRAGAGAEATEAACEYLVTQPSSLDNVTLHESEGVTQPIDPLGSFSNIFIDASFPVPNARIARLRILRWDPAALAPDPTTVALRSLYFNTTYFSTNPVSVSVPPVVTRELAHIAEPSNAMLAVDLQNAGETDVYANYDASGDPALPVVLRYGGDNVRTPVAGAHPVLSHELCGEASLQELYVVQSVMTTTAPYGVAPYEFIQRFRVPWRSRLEAVELALGVNMPATVYATGVVGILEPPAGSTPPVNVPAFLSYAYVGEYVGDLPHWSSTGGFFTPITLEPGQDYWMVVRTLHSHNLYTRSLTGAESQDFTDGIGPLFVRNTDTGAWQPLPGKALNFRIIGEPIGLVDVAGPPPASGVAMALRVTPNPARGQAVVSWARAQGAVRLTVSDVHGRRVASGAANGSAGRWTWRGTGDDGRALPAGVYHVRATDAAGVSAASRVVLVR
jgi:hypothetical protein